MTTFSLSGERVATAILLTAAARVFIEEAQLQLAAQEVQALLEPLEKPGGLVIFSRRLRHQLVGLIGRVDTERWWKMIDAIGFWEDSFPGRWPYMTGETRRQRLSWAREFTAEALA